MASSQRSDYPFVPGRVPPALIAARYHPYQRLSLDGQMAAELGWLAQMAGATSATDVLVLHRAKTIKIRKRDWHVRAWKVYHKGLAAELKAACGYPDCVFDKVAGAHYIDASTFSLSRLLRIAAGYVSHVVYFDEKAGDNSNKALRIYVSKAHIADRRARAQARDKSRDKSRDDDRSGRSSE